MNTKHILLGVIASASMVVGFTSCDDYLNTDKYFYNQTSLDSVFQRKSLLMQHQAIFQLMTSSGPMPVCHSVSLLMRLSAHGRMIAMPVSIMPWVNLINIHGNLITGLTIIKASVRLI